jgi:hypothetical protein
VLCCSVCDDVANEGKVPVPTVDVKELDGESGLEVCMKMQDTQMFFKVMQLLSDPNIKIGDTGVSVDMTPASEGLTNTRPCGVSVHVVNNEQARLRLGHMSEEATRKTATAIDWKLKAGPKAPCESCAIGKGRQKKLPKENRTSGKVEEVSKVPRLLIFQGQRQQ